MIFRKQKNSVKETEETNKVSDAGYVVENAIDSRLSGLRFKILNKSEFENKEHSINQISFVRVYENGEFSHFELYKGDILILPNAEPISNKIGKAVRINTALDDYRKYFYQNNSVGQYNRYAITTPVGESTRYYPRGFISDTGNGNFFHTTQDGRIQLGICNPITSNKVIEGCSKLSVKIAHGNTEETITYEIVPMSWTPLNARTRTPVYDRIMIRVNGTYYVGSSGYTADLLNNHSYFYGGLTGYDKDSGYWSDIYKYRHGLYLSMPYIHNHNLPEGTDRFEVRLGIWNAYATDSNWNNRSITGSCSELFESSDEYHRLGLRYSLSDGSDLGIPTFKECFVEGFQNYEDFLDIASIICTPTIDTQGNTVII